MLELVFLEAEQWANFEQKLLKIVAVWENTVLKVNVQIVETGNSSIVRMLYLPYAKMHNYAILK